MRKSVVLFSFLIIFLIAQIVLVQEMTAATLQEVKEAVLRYEQAVMGAKNLHVHCKNLQCQDILHSPYSGGDIPQLLELAWKDNRFMAKRTFVPTAAQKKIPNLLISEEPCTYLVQEKNSLQWELGNETCFVEPFDEVAMNMIQNWSIFELLGLNITKKMFDSMQMDYSDYCQKKHGKEGYEFLQALDLLEAFSNNQFVVKSSADVVDGESCIVLEKRNHEILWFSISKRFALRKRMSYDPKDGQIRYAAIFTDHFEFVPDVFLPKQIIVDHYANPNAEPKKNWGKVAKRLTYNLSISNDDDAVTDSMFEVELPPGTRVIDGLHRQNYTVSFPNKKPFEDVIAQGIGELKKQERMMMWRFIGVVIFNICIIIVVWLYVRGKERQNRENKKKGDDKTKK